MVPCPPIKPNWKFQISNLKFNIDDIKKEYQVLKLKLKMIM